MSDTPQRLLFGHDTLECAYFLVAKSTAEINFEHLAFEKESLRHNKNPEPKVITLGGTDFLLHPYGTSGGYPFVIENKDFLIRFGQYNSPSFFVKYQCQALWQKGPLALHEEFMNWADAVGLVAHHEEALSRVDFAFDYQIETIDFNEDDFVSLARKDSRYRKDRVTQTFQYGKSDVVLRVYDKVAEITEQSHKDWFYTLWETDTNVWRIEWQCRKPILKRFGLVTIKDLIEGQGDVLRYLATEHDTLRVPSSDTNRSRWPLHALWQDLQTHINDIEGVGVYRTLDDKAILAENKERIAISIYGYMKRLAALQCVISGAKSCSLNQTVDLLKTRLDDIHEPFIWPSEVEKRVNKIRLGS